MIIETERERIAQWQATRVFYENQQAVEPNIVNIGGARSSKSYSIAQLMIYKFMTERNKTFLTSRKTLPSLRLTAYKMAIDIMKQYGIYDLFEHNRSERTLKYAPTNNFWVFTSIDDPEKIKSTEFNYIYMEEANEFSYDDFMTLRLRLSGSCAEQERNQLFLSLNPSEEHGWVRTILMQRADTKIIKSNYLDNPFLPAEYIKQLEALKEQDEAYWIIYGLGEFAPIRELIYGAPQIIDEIPLCDDIIYGLDFGFNNPTVLIEIHLKEWACYLRQIVHRSFLTNSDLISIMKELIIPYHRKRPIYADSSEPARIEEIAREGFNVYPANKDVRAGILFLKRFKIRSLAENIETNREFSTYKWRCDRLGSPTDEPLKFEDHAPDAVRYGVYSHRGAIAQRGYYLAQSKQDAY